MDDIARIFSSSVDASQVCSKVNDETAADEMLLDGISSKEEDPMSSDDRSVRLPITSEQESSAAGNEAPLQDSHKMSAEDEILLPGTPLGHQFPDNEGDISFPPSDLYTVSLRDEKSEPAIIEDLNCSFNKIDDAYTEEWEPSLSNTSNNCNPVNKFNPPSPSGSVKFSSVPENVGASSIFTSKTLSLDVLEAVPSAPVDSTPSKDVVFGIQDEMPSIDLEKRPSNATGVDSVIEPSGAQDVPEMKALPRADDLERKDPFVSVSATLCEKEFPKCGTNRGAEIMSFPETDSSLFPSKDAISLRELSSECDAPEGKASSRRAEDLEKKDPFMGAYNIMSQTDFAKSGTDGGADSMSLPESVRFIEVSKDMKAQGQRDTVSVADSTPSRDILVNMEVESKASPTPTGCRQQHSKRGKP